jgi:hypothetical protein
MFLVNIITHLGAKHYLKASLICLADYKRLERAVSNHEQIIITQNHLKASLICLADYKRLERTVSDHEQTIINRKSRCR